MDSEPVVSAGKRKRPVRQTRNPNPHHDDDDDYEDDDSRSGSESGSDSMSMVVDDEVDSFANASPTPFNKRKRPAQRAEVDRPSPDGIPFDNPTEFDLGTINALATEVPETTLRILKLEQQLVTSETARQLAEEKLKTSDDHRQAAKNWETRFDEQYAEHQKTQAKLHESESELNKLRIARATVLGAFGARLEQLERVNELEGELKELRRRLATYEVAEVTEELVKIAGKIVRASGPEKGELERERDLLDARRKEKEAEVAKWAGQQG